MNRIVLCDQYFPPDTAATARIAESFAAACADQRIPLTIVCGYPSYEPGQRPAWRPLRRVQDATHTRIVVGSTGFDRRRVRGRVVNYLTFMLGAAVVLPFVTARNAFVVMTDPPMAPLLAWWVRKLGRPTSVAVWVQDLHPDFGVAAGLMRNRVLARVWRRALKASLRVADDIVVLGRDMTDRVNALRPDAPTRVVHNGWDGVTAAPPVVAHDGPLKVMHFGNVGFSGPWDTVLTAARQLEGEAEFVFVGGGAAEDVLTEAPDNVTTTGRIPHDEVSAVAAQADLLLVGTRSGIEGYAVPSKGYEMMALGRPLLVVGAPSSEMRRLVEELDCGVGVDDTPDAVVAAIRSVAGDRSRVAAMADNARAAAPQFHRNRQFGPLAASWAYRVADRDGGGPP